MVSDLAANRLYRVFAGEGLWRRGVVPVCLETRLSGCFLPSG